jgi:hypothetical protein
MKSIVFIVCLSFFCNPFVWGQDILQKTNKSKLEVRIIEIGTDEIKYKNFNDLEGPIYVISKRDVLSIQRENGEIIQFEKDFLEVSESPASHKRRAIGIDPFSPLFRHLGIGYQQWVKPGVILEAKAGYIGIGFQSNRIFDDFNDEKKGAFISLGSKLLFKQLIYSKGTRIVHPLAGGYFRTQVSFSYFTHKERVYDFYYNPNSYTPNYYDAKFENYSIALNLIIGKQFLIADALLLDIYLGAGYGFANHHAKSYVPPTYDTDVGAVNYFHSHYIVSEQFPLSYTSGISLSLLLK